MEAQTTQQEIFSYAPNNTAVQDYKDFVDELIERGL
jgi:cellulose biosynthesis protein BcsQ